MLTVVSVALLLLCAMSAVKSVALKLGSGGLILPAAFAKHSATVILMHGLGDSADGLEDLAAMWRNQFPHIKFVLPTAPQRPVTLNSGATMNAWYNINGIDDRAHDPCEGLEESASFINSLIRNEQDMGLPRSRIMLAGFSQGGALSLFTGLQLPTGEDASASCHPADPLAGILVLSAYVPKIHAFHFNADYRQVPVFHCHGEADPLIQPSWAVKSRDHLLAQGLSSYTLKTYPGVAHSISMHIIRDAAKFMESALPHQDSLVIPPQAPKTMSVKEIKEALREHGLLSKASGLTEKHELVELLEAFYKQLGLTL